MTTAWPAVPGATPRSECIHLSHVILGDLGALTFTSHPGLRSGTTQVPQAFTSKFQKHLPLFLAIVVMIPQSMALFSSLPEAQCKKVHREPRFLVLYRAGRPSNQVLCQSALLFGNEYPCNQQAKQILPPTRPHPLLSCFGWLLL